MYTMNATIIKPIQNTYIDIAADKNPLRDTIPEYRRKVKNSVAFHLSTSRRERPFLANSFGIIILNLGKVSDIVVVVCGPILRPR